MLMISARYGREFSPYTKGTLPHRIRGWRRARCIGNGRRFRETLVPIVLRQSAVDKTFISRTQGHYVNTNGRILSTE